MSVSKVTQEIVNMYSRTDSHVNSEMEENSNDRDSDVSLTSGEFCKGSDDTPQRKGSYDFMTRTNVVDEDDYEFRNRANVVDEDDYGFMTRAYVDEDDYDFMTRANVVDEDEYDRVSIEIEESDSVFGSDQECSSLSVSESESELSLEHKQTQQVDTANTNRFEYYTTNEPVEVPMVKDKVENSFFETSLNDVNSPDRSKIIFYENNKHENNLPEKVRVEDIKTVENILSPNKNDSKTNELSEFLFTDKIDSFFIQARGNGISSPSKRDLDYSKTNKFPKDLPTETNLDSSCEEMIEGFVKSAENPPGINMARTDCVKCEMFHDSSRSIQIDEGVNLINIEQVGPVESPINTETEYVKTPRPSALQLNSSGPLKKRALLPQSRAAKSNTVLSPDVIEGMILNLGWVDRVNKAIVANAQKVVSVSNEDLIKHARECKIMKRFSEKEARNLNRPVQKLKKRSPSDIRHDRPTELRPDPVNCCCHLFHERESSCSTDYRKFSEYFLGACFHKKANGVPSFLIPSTDRVKSEYDSANNAATNTKDMSPSILHEPSLSSQQPVFYEENVTNTRTLSLDTEQVIDCSTDGQIMNTSVRSDFNITKADLQDTILSYRESECNDNLENKEEQDSTDGGNVPAEVKPDKGASLSPQGLIRKPAVRRKGFAWLNQNFLKNSSSDVRRKGHRKLFKGSSLDLAPSLLNLLDRRLSSGGRDNNEDRHPGKLTVTKTQSLPAARTDEDIDEVEYRRPRLPSQKLPPDRPVSMMDAEPVVHRYNDVLVDKKKRPLSISSVSSISMTSSPRLRKKRASTFNGDATTIVRECCQDSSCTLVPEREPGAKSFSTLESSNSVDSGCVEGYKSGDRCFDRMSLTSEAGSCRDETDSTKRDSSVKDYSEVPSNHSERHNSPPVQSVTQRSNVQSPSFVYRARKHGSSTPPDISRSQSSSANKQAIHITSPKHGSTSSAVSKSRSLDNRPSRTERDAKCSPNNSGRSSSTSTRQDARLRFFSNYEEHLRQPSSLRAPIAEEIFDFPPSSKIQSTNEHSTIPRLSSKHSSVPQSSSKRSLVPQSSNDNSSIPQASSKAVASEVVFRTEFCQIESPDHSSNETTPAPTSPVSKTERSRDHSSQLAPNSERATRKSDRHGSVSKHDRKSTSPRSGLSRTSKKRDPLNASDLGSKSTPVYVTYVSRVVAEIIESERTYIASLEDIIHGYLEPMENILGTNEAKKDIMCLFSNIREIYQFGCIFLNDLESAGADPVKVAQCFVKYNKGFVIYTDYCTNYPRAVEVLTRFMQHPALSQLCKDRQLALGHGLPLGAYLLKPVQRILKYHLLLHNIVKNCEKEKEEAAILEQAFHHMTQMAHHINEMKRKHEHAVRIQEIQSQLEDYVGEDLTRLGELVLEGTFKVSGAKASRQVFLFEKGLLISKMKLGGMLSCKTFIRCSNLMLVEVITNEPLSFHIIPFDNPRAQETLQARNMEQKQRWCHDIKKQILESFKGRIPDNAKTLIMQLGKDHDDDYISKETLDAGRRNQHTAPEYLEKRRFRRKSGSRLPEFNLLKTKKGGNKKNEVKSGEKISAVKLQRSESRSPEVHRHIQSKQNFITKRRSQSTSSSPVSLSTSPYTYLSDQSPAESNHAITQPSKIADYSSPKSTSPDSPISRKSPKKFTYSKDGKEEIRIEAETNKRPVSFLMARANSILSEDGIQLLARCGDTKKVASPPILEEEKEHAHSSLTDFSDMGELSFKRRSDEEEFPGNDEPKETVEEIRQVKSQKLADSDPHMTERNSIYFSKSCKNTPVFSETEISLLKSGLNQNVKESRKTYYKSISLPDLNKAVEDLDENKVASRRTNIKKNKNASQNLENMYGKDNVPKAKSLVSRKDLLYNGQNLSPNGKIENGAENENWKKEKEVMAFQGKYRKTANENVLLRKAGLRLPNTSKLLSAKECGPNLQADDIRSKLANTGEKPTRDSFGNLSHLDENSSIIDSAITSSNLSMDAESLSSSRSSLSVTSRSLDHSDMTEMIPFSDNKENLEILRGNRMSALLYGCSVRREKLETERKFSSQIPYATPPRGYMSFENMKSLGSLKDADRSWFPYQDLSDSSFSKSASGTVNSLGISPVTVTIAKPVSFNTSNLLRSSSTPIHSESQDFAAKNTSKGRSVSMDVDKLTEESNRLVAEMEEYINNSSENIKSTNKFPTSIPTIPVEGEDASSHRLSIVSSISTSSYESQCSSSSDGLVGTLKSKLRAWARLRNDSEYSYASTFNSDDEYQEEFTNSESGSTLELQLKSRNSWKDNSELENVLPEHSLEFSEFGSYLEYHLKPVLAEQVSSSHGTDFSASESQEQVNFDFDSVDFASGKSEILLLRTEKQLEQAQLLHPYTVKTTKTLMPSAFKNDDIQHSDSDFFRNNETNINDQPPLTNTVVAETLTDLLEESSKQSTPVIRPFMETIISANESLNLRKNDSFKCSDYKDSCSEKKLSDAVESEAVKENSENCDSNQKEDEEVPLPRKSIREYVQDFEEKTRAQSQKVVEIKKREPGVMIRQRLETLRGGTLHNRPSSSHNSSRPLSEERDFLRSKSPPPTHEIINTMPFIAKNGDLSDTSLKSIYTKILGTNDCLSKSIENLSKSQESMYLSRSKDSLSKSRDSLSRSKDSLSKSRDSLSRSRDSLNSMSNFPCNRHSAPIYALKSNNPGHEKDAIRFHHKSPETIPTLSGNQFIHKARTGSQQSVLVSETSTSTATEAVLQPSSSSCHLDELDTDSLIGMKGWVRALISKFQDK